MGAERVFFINSIMERGALTQIISNVYTHDIISFSFLDNFNRNILISCSTYVSTNELIKIHSVMCLIASPIGKSREIGLAFPSPFIFLCFLGSR